MSASSSSSSSRRGKDKRQWYFDLRQQAAPDNSALAESSSGSSSLRKKINDKALLPFPPGYDQEYSTKDDSAGVVSAEKELQAKQRQAMALAYSPAKSLFTTAFMLWMSGSSIQIFSIMTTGMALINPLKAIGTVEQAFSKFDGVDLKLPKLIFIALQLLALGVALYKCSTMGLLPVTSADWTSYLRAKEISELAAFHI